MKEFLQRLLKWLAYAAAGVVILLAIAVGLFRLFLPRLPEYQEDIKSWASTAIGLNVEFSGMDARWGLSGPEIEFYDAELISPDNAVRVVAAEEVGVGLALSRLLFERAFVIDRVVVRDTELVVRQLEDGQWWIQGGPPGQFLPKRERSAADGDAATDRVGAIEFIGEDIEVQFLQAGDQRPRIFRIPRLSVSRDEARLAVDAGVELPGDLGRELTVSAIRLRQAAGTPGDWHVSLEAEQVSFAGVSALHALPAAQFTGGIGDLSVALAVGDGRLQSLAADIEVADVRVADENGFSFAGHIEYRRDPDGWLAAATDFVLQTASGAWPESSVRIETGTDADGRIVLADVRASYLRLADAGLVMPWLSDAHQATLRDIDPDGVVQNLTATVSDLGAAEPRFNVVAEFAGVGFAASGKRPGLRGFTGSLRADRGGGRLEIQSENLAVNLPAYLDVPVLLDEAGGTIIWRQSASRTTVLSDSIVLRNTDFDLRSNVELTLPRDGRAPVVDLASSFSISDISSAKRYIPTFERMPRTSEWFQEGLIAGRIPRGSIRLNGPLDKFPFDDGEGRFQAQANIRDARILYARGWPAVDVIDLDLSVENLRLLSERNRVVNAGNPVSNARVEIADFRNPVLTVNAVSATTLDAMRQLIAQSPLGEKVFKGKLDELTVSGEGSFSLDLRVPIRDVKNFAYTSRLQTGNGSIQMQGFPAPLTDLGGVVTISRDDISSEAFGGVFLGRPVSIELMPAPDSLPQYRVVAAAEGVATTVALEAELGLPIGDRASGETAYAARLLFPRGGQEPAVPFAVEINSDLTGIGVDLPMPFRKPASEAIGLNATIELPEGGQSIVSQGVADGLMTWRMGFEKTGDLWDLDRGVVTFGGETADEAETRGLHLRGNTSEVVLQEWLDLAEQRQLRTGMGDRIRSIDMRVANLHLLGQHLVDHEVRVDRSARDWLVQFDGADIVGSAFIPYDFTSGRPLVLEMQRLVLPGESPEWSRPQRQIDPRSLPPITVNADEFAFGNRFLGKVEANFLRTVDGLVSETLQASDASFRLGGSAQWIVDESDPTGHRSFVTVTLNSTDVARTMDRLGYDPGIISDELSMLLDLNWSGGPREDFMDSLNGVVNVRVGKGQLADIEPGAGRVFGLMSIVALPRRLSLDFRDVFSKGFGFDKISGSFAVVDGETRTCNLSLEGPAADIGIVGRAGLAARDYDQAAIVSANFGNTLPVVGAVVAGPQVGAVLLVFSQIFKKPLQEVSQVYYQIGGSWDDPLIDSMTADEFAEFATASGCIDNVTTG